MCLSLLLLVMLKARIYITIAHDDNYFHPKIKIIMIFFGLLNTKEGGLSVWKVSVVQNNIRPLWLSLYRQKQFFRIPSFLFHRIPEVIKVYNDMNVRKLWQNSVPWRLGISTNHTTGSIKEFNTGTKLCWMQLLHMHSYNNGTLYYITKQ